MKGRTPLVLYASKGEGDRQCSANGRLIRVHGGGHHSGISGHGAEVLQRMLEDSRGTGTTQEYRRLSSTSVNLGMQATKASVQTSSLRLGAVGRAGRNVSAAKSASKLDGYLCESQFRFHEGMGPCRVGRWER